MSKDTKQRPDRFEAAYAFSLTNSALFSSDKGLYADAIQLIKAALNIQECLIEKTRTLQSRLRCLPE
jgi:hypothetical protein